MPSIDSLYSQASDIGAKISSQLTSSNVKDAVGKFSDAVQSKAKTASLQIKSMFETKDLAKQKAAASAKDSKSPQQAKQNVNKFAGALMFPSDMKYFTKFSFIVYDKRIVNVGAKDLPSKVIILPMPNNLKETFGVSYDTPALGPVVGAAANSIANAIRTGSPGSLVSDSVSDAAKTGVTAGVAGGLNALKSMGGKGETVAAIGSQALGVAPNPNLAVLFSNIGLREHSFSYKFAPTSLKEVNTLKEIIYELKRRMLPGMVNDGSMLFSFPDVCDIEFGPDKTKPYTILRCVMTSLDINYTPMGSPAFFKDGDSVMVEISMSFKEVKPFTREDIIAFKATTQPQPVVAPAKPAASPKTATGSPFGNRGGR